MASRKISDLAPDVRILAEKFLDQADAQGIDVLVTCTYRSGIEQAGLAMIYMSQYGHHWRTGLQFRFVLP